MAALWHQGGGVGQLNRAAKAPDNAKQRFLESGFRVSACMSSCASAGELHLQGGKPSFQCLERDCGAAAETVSRSIKLKSMNPVRTLILDNYDSYTYNLFQLISMVNGEAPTVVKNDELSFAELHRLLYKERAFDNVVISPGPGSPTCSSDIGICMQVFQECPDVPILGVCMGHQVLGYAYGMKLLHAPQPVHGRLSEIEHVHHPLFKGVPSGSGFKAVRYHSLVLDGTSLPVDLLPTAWTISEKPIPVGFCQGINGLAMPDVEGLEDHRPEFFPGQSKKLIMGVSHRARPHHGLQFHPESVATTHGRKLLENFRDMTNNFLWEHFGQTFHSKRGLGALKLETKSFEQLASLKLFFRKLQGDATACGDADAIFSRLYGAESANDTFWLDSSTVDQGRARFSYMGGKGGALWKKIIFRLSSGALRVENALGEASEQKLQRGFFDYLDKETQARSCRKEDYAELPFDFIGGFIGYLGYELKRECGAAFNRHSSSAPDAAFFMVDRFVAIDHCTGDIYMVAVSDATNSEAAEAWVEATANTILQMKPRPEKPDHIKCCTSLNRDVLTPLKTKSEYMEDVRRCLKHITDGESYEICLTTQLNKQTKLNDKLGLYRLLRQINPAPYAAWLNFGKDGPCICSSSPERFLRLDQTGVLEAKPIKGTAPRGKTPEEDERMRSQLENSEKDQAENLMIVDLLRNDLGRVCAPGTVQVPILMAIESYSTVHTMVSTVRGKKRDDKTPLDCVRAAFPGGSMTGAPKLRTMEILDSIESTARGVYSGAIGFFSLNSSFDLNIVIRTLVIHGDKVSIGAGGAVVALSDPEAEYEEMLLKTKAPGRALEAFHHHS